MRCVTLNGGPRRISRTTKEQLYYRLRSWAKWTILALEEVLLSIYQNSRVISFRGSMTDVSVALRLPCWCLRKGHPHCVSIKKLFKFRRNSYPNNAGMKNSHRPKSRRGRFSISIINHIPDSWPNLHVLNGYDFCLRCKPPSHQYPQDHLSASIPYSARRIGFAYKNRDKLWLYRLLAVTIMNEWMRMNHNIKVSGLN